MDIGLTMYKNVTQSEFFHTTTQHFLECTAFKTLRTVRFGSNIDSNWLHF